MNYAVIIFKEVDMAVIGIIISLSSFIGGIIFREIVNFFKESKLEEKRLETGKKQFFAENFFPIYKDTYRLLCDLETNIKDFKNHKISFTYINENVSDVIEIQPEDLKKYNWGEDKDLVYTTNLIFHLQLVQNNTTELRELHLNNEIMFSLNENTLIKDYYEITDNLIFIVKEVMDLRNSIIEEEEYFEKTVQQLGELKSEIRDEFRNRFVF